MKDIRDRAGAARQYAKAAGYSREITNMCAEIKIRAERKAGTLLADMPKQAGARDGKQTGSQAEIPLPPRLDDIGVSKTQSHRWQQSAAIPDDVVDMHKTTSAKSSHQSPGVGQAHAGTQKASR